MGFPLDGLYTTQVLEVLTHETRLHFGLILDRCLLIQHIFNGIIFEVFHTHCISVRVVIVPACLSVSVHLRPLLLHRRLLLGCHGA